MKEAKTKKFQPKAIHTFTVEVLHTFAKTERVHINAESAEQAKERLNKAFEKNTHWTNDGYLSSSRVQSVARHIAKGK